ncbi:MAG: SpoIID/LytB domain-containing protein [Muribaculaceae bacterium]|nr:SpoIID/LytB domain-containing protein [Muribaculaceae bacterium]
MIINIGIRTKGIPQIRKNDNFIIVENLLIGDGFHWEKTIEARLPGEITYVNAGINNSTAYGSNVSLINHAPMETYLECVVGSEMNPTAPEEFLKAHAVISRSWAVGKVFDIHFKGREGSINNYNTLIGWEDTASHRGFHVCSDDHCQRYQGLQPISKEAERVIHDTEGEILVSSSGKIIDARFSKCCGGKTELFSTCWQSVDPLSIESIDDPWCDLFSLDPIERESLLKSILKDYDLATENYGFRWTSEISKKEIKENLKKRFNRDVGVIKEIDPLHRGPSGRIDLLRIYGTSGYLDLGKELWIRRLLSPTHLYSSNFEVEERGEIIKIKGRGWGHGVGLCQIGAAHMAAKGASYKEILEFYYPGSRLQKLYI